MKVICAGACKTGTKTMAAALRALGYEVYDFMEQYNYLGSEWERIFKTGGSTEDFRRMFADVDAVTDAPACHFWDEIHKAYPDSKIILMTRKDEDDWWKSMEKQLETDETPAMRIWLYFSPTLYRYRRFLGKLTIAIFGCDETSAAWFGKGRFNELLLRMAFRRHNACVIQNAPKDKLLIYSVKEGWGPLCRFLEKDIPSKPFPHKNKSGEYTGEIFKSDPTLIRANREIYCSLALLSLLAVFGAYKLAKYVKPLDWLKLI